MIESFEPFACALDNIEVEKDGFERTVNMARHVRPRGTLYFIGNGGSAAIASHMAIDWLNKGKFTAMSFNDGAALTCLANDYGYAEVFKRQLLQHATYEDLLIAISSSGRSENIITAVEAVKEIMAVVTLTGFDGDNLLREMGNINFWVPSRNYGVVETVHLGILHALLDAVSA